MRNVHGFQFRSAVVAKLLNLTFGYRPSIRYLHLLQKDGQTHLLEFVRQDERIPPTPNTEPRLAYEDGKIADYLMYQHKNAWLVV